jgi:arginase
MDLAFVTGRGPDIVTNIEGCHPLVRDEDVTLLAHRDTEDAESHGSQRVEDTGIGIINLHALRECGAHASASRALERLIRTELDGFWIHLDADVLDDAIMPAVDYRMPGGLQWDELSTILRTALASGKALGIDITIFNPKLDKDGSIARRFVEALGEGLSGISYQRRATSG